MDEYISREAVINITAETGAWETQNRVRELPAADVEPVRHGRWIATNDENKKRCSECDIIHLIAQYPCGKANYCPNCGVKMDGDANG